MNLQTTDGLSDRKNFDAFIFAVDGMLYAVPVSDVKQVMKLPPVTPIPGTPDAIMGIFHLRGKVILTLDLASRLCIGTQNKHQKNFICIVHCNNEQFAIPIEQPKTIVRVTTQSLLPPDTFGMTPLAASYMTGIFMYETQLKHIVENVQSRELNNKSLDTQNTNDQIPVRPVFLLDVARLFDEEDLERRLAFKE